MHSPGCYTRIASKVREGFFKTDVRAPDLSKTAVPGAQVRRRWARRTLARTPVAGGQFARRIYLSAWISVRHWMSAKGNPPTPRILLNPARGGGFATWRPYTNLIDPVRFMSRNLQRPPSGWAPLLYLM